MIEYSIKMELNVKIEGENNQSFTYEENGFGPVGNLEETFDMFILPRFSADGKILVDRAKKNIFEGNKDDRPN